MNGFILALFLIATLLVARRWPQRTQRLHSANPLDVDDGIPFPEAGQGSSVFSLTALFGPYLAMALLFGVASLVGLACGSVIGLLYVHRTIRQSRIKSFEDFLLKTFPHGNSSAQFFLILLSVTHLAFALSEMLILKDISVIWLHMSPTSASFFAVCISLIAYLYCLDGGYIAVFRTDVLQFVFVGILCLIISFFGIVNADAKLENLNLLGQQPTLWFSDNVPAIVSHSLNFIVSLLMAVCFILGTPDTWKRIYITSQRRKHNSILGLVLAGNLPFLLILPLALFGNGITDSEFLQFRFVFEQIETQSAFIQMLVLLGFISCFLSSFDSSLLNSAHTLSLAKITSQKGKTNCSGLQEYHRNIGAIFLCLNVLFTAYPVMGVNNPYLLANILLGNFAVIGGVLVASKFFSLTVNHNDFVAITLIGIAFWTVFTISQPDILQMPSRIQIETIPCGIALFLIVIIFVLYRLKRTQ